MLNLPSTTSRTDSSAPSSVSARTRTRTRGRTAALTTAAALTASLLAAGATPALAATPGSEALSGLNIAPYEGYIQDISIVEDTLPASGNFTMAVDFCLAPGAVGGDTPRDTDGLPLVSLMDHSPLVAAEVGKAPKWTHLTQKAALADGTGLQLDWTRYINSGDGPEFGTELKIALQSGERLASGGCGRVLAPMTASTSDRNVGEVDFLATTTHLMPSYYDDLAMLPRAGARVATAAPTAKITGTWFDTRVNTLCTDRLADNIDPKASFYPYIQWMGCEGITTGYADGDFRPSRTLTRGELAVFALRAAERESQDIFDEIPDSSWNRFSDVPAETELAVAVSWLHSKGLKGNKDGTFRPQAKVTRAEAARMLFVASDADDTYRAPTKAVFKDVSTSSYAHAPVAWLKSQGVTGYTDRTFRPDRTITRGEMSKLLFTATR